MLVRFLVFPSSPVNEAFNSVPLPDPCVYSGHPVPAASTVAHPIPTFPMGGQLQQGKVWLSLITNVHFRSVTSARVTHEIHFLSTLSVCSASMHHLNVIFLVFIALLIFHVHWVCHLKSYSFFSRIQVMQSKGNNNPE